MVLLSSTEIFFPDPRIYDPPDGLIAIGGDLSADRILFAYQLGIFPWFEPESEILWWCPDPRCVLFPKNLKISKSMRNIFKDEVFTFTENKCFYEVMQNCQNIKRKEDEGTWISEKILKTYHELHLLGVAKSIEVWQEDRLVGGLYGLVINSVFCGESMFAHKSNASKAGFIYFVEKYRNVFSLIDCQIETPHLTSLGAELISKEVFLNHLQHKK